MDTHQQHGHHMLTSSILSTYAVTISNNREASKEELQANRFRWFQAKDTWMFRLQTRKAYRDIHITKNAEVVTLRPLAAKDLVRSHDRVCGKCDGQSGNGTSVSLNTMVFPCQSFRQCSIHSFIHPSIFSAMLYELGNAKRL